MGAVSQDSAGIAIHESDIAIGEPLPWDVYDGHGNLLLRQGFIIRAGRQREALVARGLHRKWMQGRDAPSLAETRPVPEAPAETRRVFDLVDALIERLKWTYTAMVGGRADAPARLEQIALDIQAACEAAPDAMLAALHISQDGPYALLDPLHGAVLCELVTRRLGTPARDRLPIVAAALSHDVGMLEMQEALRRQATPLSETQWVEVRRHPAKGVDLLVRAGVENAVWLDAALHHHERLDGSGYPDGLAGDSVSMEARLVAIADVYAAMVRPRAYRDALLATAALRQIFMERGKQIDARLAEVFIKEVGVFPPGALVRLASGEVGVVAGRSEDASHPPVFGVLSKQGGVATRAVERDTRQAEHAIVEMLPHRKFRALTGTLRGFWPPLPSGRSL